MQVTRYGTIEDLTDSEAEELYSIVTEVMAGETSIRGYDVYRSWCQDAGLTDSIMVKATVFPQKALAALVEHYRTKLGCNDGHKLGLRRKASVG